MIVEAVRDAIGWQRSATRREQRLDRPAFVHGAIALRHVGERQLEVEDLAGLILRVSTRSIRCGRKRRTGAGPPSRPVCEKNSVLAVELDAVGHARR